MKTRILANLEDETRNLVEREYKASPVFRKRLIEVLERDIDTLRTEVESQSMTKEANWEYEVVDKLAQIRATKKIIELFS